MLGYCQIVPWAVVAARPEFVSIRVVLDRGVVVGSSTAEVKVWTKATPLGLAARCPASWRAGAGR